jgi:flavorubredoxin
MYFLFSFSSKKLEISTSEKRTNLGFDVSSIFIPQSYPHSEDVMTSQNTRSNVIGQKYFLSGDFIGQFTVK